MDIEQINRIKELAKPIVEQEDLMLIDVEEKGGDETVVWVYVDSEEGSVSVEACSAISRELGFVLDAHNLVSSRYRLNVSSPGLNRPLSDPRQYRKNRGRVVRVKYKDSSGYEKLEGTLKEVTGDQIEVEADKGRKTILFDRIVETKVIPNI